MLGYQFFKRAFSFSSSFIRRASLVFIPPYSFRQRYCEKEGILVESYSPIAHGQVLKSKELAATAKKYGVTVAQLCIRYDIQLDTVALPKTANPAHMKENAAVDFTIGDADMEALKNIVQIKSYGLMKIMPVFSGK